MTEYFDRTKIVLGNQEIEPEPCSLSWSSTNNYTQIGDNELNINFDQVESIEFMPKDNLYFIVYWFKDGASIRYTIGGLGLDETLTELMTVCRLLGERTND